MVTRNSTAGEERREATILKELSGEEQGPKFWSGWEEMRFTERTLIKDHTKGRGSKSSLMDP